jgi:exopolysaccharide biosynthesis polyprenyl glycosylphosphotransferase
VKSTVTVERVASQAKRPRSLVWSFPLNTSERRVLLATGDAVAAGLAFELGQALWSFMHQRPAIWIGPAPLVFIAAWLLALYVVDGYDVRIPASRVRSLVVVVKAAAVTSVVALLLFMLAPAIRSVLTVSVPAGVLVITLMRLTLARGLLRETFAKHAVLVGNFDGPVLSRTLYSVRYDYHLIGMVCDSGAQRETLRRLGSIDDLPAIVLQYGVDEVILAETAMDRGSRAAEACLAAGIRLVTPMQLAERYQGRVPLQWIDREWFLSLPPRDLNARPYLVVRRLADLLLSLLISVPFLLFLPLIALLIKLDSPGPVFFTQSRVGQFGREFRLFKLRTMVTDAESNGHRWAERLDSRVTRVGRILRDARIDEFPQVLNVLRGEMSFIGPRPERPEFVAELESLIPHYRTRLAVKPGISGWAQVKDGYAGSIEDSARKLEFDLFYVKNQCLRLDMQIVFHTLFTVLGLQGR